MVKVVEIWNTTLKIPIFIEIVGIGVTTTGIGIELAMGSHIGHLLITCGATLISAGGLIFAKLIRKPKL